MCPQGRSRLSNQVKFRLLKHQQKISRQVTTNLLNSAAKVDQVIENMSFPFNVRLPLI